jgi:hypothetical protein
MKLRNTLIQKAFNLNAPIHLGLEPVKHVDLLKSIAKYSNDN